MRGRRAVAVAIVAMMALAAPASSKADPAERTSSIADRTSVNLTIYNGTIALVHDRRRIALDKDANRVAWRDVSAQMDATTAILEDLSTPGGVSVVEQNFDFDLLDPQAVLNKYVGREVTVVHDRPVAGRPMRESAKVLATNGGAVLQYADRVETFIDGHLEFPNIPADLRDRPTLVLDLQSTAAGAADLDLSYLTSGLDWHADYVGVVAPDESHMDLNGLVTLSNTSGTSFENAHLQLVAGKVNVPAPPSSRVMYTVAASALQPHQFTQENYFEYHLYTLGRTTSIGNNQTKQVELLSARNVPIRKTLELRGDSSYYTNASPDLGTKLQVGVYVTFANKDGDLGIPLPGGTVRLYKNDTGGTSQFLGADRIDHTPKNEDVRLHLGDSFDVTATKKQTDFKMAGKCAYQSRYEIVVKNAKDQAADVLVVEPIPGDWTITAENLPHTKTSSSTASWTVHVPADASSTLDYTTLVKDCV